MIAEVYDTIGRTFAARVITSNADSVTHDLSALGVRSPGAYQDLSVCYSPHGASRPGEKHLNFDPQCQQVVRGDIRSCQALPFGQFDTGSKHVRCSRTALSSGV